MKLYVIAVVTLCAVVAACGSSSGGNSAVNKTFTYGTPTAANSDQLSTMDGQLTSAMSVKSSTNADYAPGVGEFDTTSLLGSPYTSTSALSMALQTKEVGQSASGLAISNAINALKSRSFDASCITTTDTSVTYHNCSVTGDSAYGSGTVSFDGSFTISADRQTLTWDLTMHGSIPLTTVSGSVDVSFHYSGTITVTDTTIKGNLLYDMNVSGTMNGQSFSLGVQEALVLDVTYQKSPVCVTSGTLEAKRVWTHKPKGYNVSDKAVKITWTGCGEGNIAYSWK